MSARPEQAVAGSLAALNALAEMGRWPARDPANERQVERVRARWARIHGRAFNGRRGVPRSAERLVEGALTAGRLLGE